MERRPESDNAASLDALARELASGTISRRVAIRRLGGVLAGVALAGPASAVGSLADIGRKRCPPARRCKGKCCPGHSSCKRGRCKCISGYTKCGTKCLDLQFSPNHCGSCDNACAEGQACFDGQCTGCTTASDCPAAPECMVAVCNSGACGTGFADAGTPCVGGTCNGAGTCNDLRGCCGTTGAGTCPSGFGPFASCCHPSNGVTCTPSNSDASCFPCCGGQQLTASAPAGCCKSAVVDCCAPGSPLCCSRSSQSVDCCSTNPPACCSSPGGCP
ncbi:MAG: hypothetical protein QOI31_2459 [Solirubrobacterales bacterium]|jgi:hypothetical protein|nr:hypothetical protein [Solirubrobacterales bacterium]